MDYFEMRNTIGDISTPVRTIDDNGDAIVINEGMTDKGLRFYHTLTSQNTGWVRHNIYYEDLTQEEYYDV